MSLGDHLESAQKSLFRFEYIQDFDIEAERQSVELFHTNRSLEVESLMGEWWSFIKKKRQNGVVCERVRYVRYPLSKYLEWELQVHKKTTAFGDDIRILPENKILPNLQELGDFWMIDDAEVLIMNYDSQGAYIGFQVEAVTDTYSEAKQYLLKHSFPIQDFI
jgi:hypothetical protein